MKMMYNTNICIIGGGADDKNPNTSDRPSMCGIGRHFESTREKTERTHREAVDRLIEQAGDSWRKTVLREATGFGKIKTISLTSRQYGLNEIDINHGQVTSC